MKQYNKATIRILVMTPDIIATSVTVHNEQGNGTQLAPTRKTIWD